MNAFIVGARQALYDKMKAKPESEFFLIEGLLLCYHDKN